MDIKKERYNGNPIGQMLYDIFSANPYEGETKQLTELSEYISNERARMLNDIRKWGENERNLLRSHTGKM